jgi:hypothetical protein
MTYPSHIYAYGTAASCYLSAKTVTKQCGF